MCFIQKKVSILLTTTEETIPEGVKTQEKQVKKSKHDLNVSSYSRGYRVNHCVTIALCLLLALLCVL